MRKARYHLMVLGVAGTVLLVAPAAMAWHGKGHYDATALALRAAARDANLPAFFTQGAAAIAHCSLDPDDFTHPIAPDALHRAESPEHYFDIDVRLPGGGTFVDANLPADRYAFIALCCSRGVRPNRVGLLPYAVTEWTQRLTVAFAEHRKYPNDPTIRAKCLIYAGMLSHYAADLCQPLHTTIDYDGRCDANGKSPHSGIHAKTDALLGKLLADANTPADWPRRDANSILAGVRPATFASVLPAVLAEIRRSHALVDRVYAMETRLPAERAPIRSGTEVEKFATGRMRAAAGLIASLYMTAWKDSASIKLPWWYSRPYNPPQTKPPVGE